MKFLNSVETDEGIQVEANLHLKCSKQDFSVYSKSIKRIFQVQVIRPTVYADLLSADELLLVYSLSIE